MIKANELRIGNWLVFSNNIQPDTYVQVNARFFSALAGGRNMNEVKNDEELSGYYHPIPLTPEMLEKAGLLNNWWGENSYRIAQDAEFGWGVIVRNANHDKEIEFAYVKYVHQIQNLYFALTGQELEINL